MTTKQPSSLAEIKERIGERFSANMLDGDPINDCGGAIISAEAVVEYLLEEADWIYELGRSVGRAELLSEIKGIIAESKGDVMIVLAGLLNKLTLR